tara:strand:+ start:6700 stop:7980 length:1281 start_codon:yes stop_codon:yes gene_type:complete
MTLTLLNTQYFQKKHEFLNMLLKRLESVYSGAEINEMRIDVIDSDILSQRSGRGFVNRDLVETLLGNLLECVAPGSHNAVAAEPEKSDLPSQLSQVADQLYAMIAQSFLAVGESERIEEQALASTFGLLWDIPRLKERARWNRFAALKDPAVWDAYLLSNCETDSRRLLDLDFASVLEESIRKRDVTYYQCFLKELGCAAAFDYQMQLVMSTYPGWRILFYHDVAHGLVGSGALEQDPGFLKGPVPLLPRAISELAGRYYQADLHPETVIGDANFLDHPHRGMTTGQTGIIGSGCHIFPCTLGGLSEKIQQRHPVIGDFVFIGTDASLYGPVEVKDRSVIGANAEIHGLVSLGIESKVGASVFIGTIREEDQPPGRIFLQNGVRVGAGTIIENACRKDLVIPEKTHIPARAYVINDGDGNPRTVGG